MVHDSFKIDRNKKAYYSEKNMMVNTHTIDRFILLLASVRHIFTQTQDIWFKEMSKYSVQLHSSHRAAFHIAYVLLEL